MELSNELGGMKRLKSQMDDEISQVEVILKEVAECIKTSPEEDDTIFNGIAEVGEELESNWQKLTSTFKDISSQFEGLFNEMSAKIQEMLDLAKQQKTNC